MKMQNDCIILTDAQLEAKINELTQKIRKFRIIGGFLTVFGFIVGLIIAILTGVGIFSFLFVMPGISVGLAAVKYSAQLKTIVSNHVVRGALSEAFCLSVYEPSHHVRESIIKSTQLIDNWNRISGSDLVEGAYRGVRFSFSDVHLVREQGNGKNKSRTTRFKGQWLIIETAKDIPWTIQLRERGGLVVGKRAKSDVETENIEFNRQFQILTRDPHTAFYIFTPHFMEYILRMDRRAGAETHMYFVGRQVHIALHNGRDLFEPGGRNAFTVNNLDNLRMQMGWDVKYITGIIDELLLNECLFAANKKEEF